MYNAVETDWTAANLTVASGATLRLVVGTEWHDRFQRHPGWHLARQSPTANGNGLKGGSFFALDNASGTVTVASNLTDSTADRRSIGFKKFGAGTVELTGTNTYSGRQPSIAGTLKVSSLKCHHQRNPEP